MTTAAEVRAANKTETIKINPKLELTEEVGSFILGRIRSRRDVPWEGKTFKVYEVVVEESNAKAYEGKAPNQKQVKFKSDDVLDLKGTAMINWALSNVADGERVLIEYKGTKKALKKGQNDAHDFLVERCPAK